MRVELPNNFVPRPYQKRFMAYLDAGGKRAVWVVHRRGGKDLTALHQTCKMMHARKGVYWHVYPTAEQGRKAVWEAFRKDGKQIMENVFPAAIRRTPREFSAKQEMVVELKNGSVWRLVGSDRVELVGAGPVGVTFSEFSMARPTAWNLIRPMLRENDGWATFISTPRGMNHFWKLWKIAGERRGWFRDLQTIYDTRAYDPDETIAEERAEGMPEAVINSEYLCDWNAARVGSIWGDTFSELERRGGTAEFIHPTDGVFTSWDLGISDSTAIWFWRVGAHGVDFIDFYESAGKPMSHYFDEVDRRGYRYIKHWLPHDARARTLATGHSILDQCLGRWGPQQVAITPSLSLQDGIQAFRWLLQQDTRFHPRCRDGMEAIREYRYDWDEAARTFSRLPVHDWASHACDAARYTAACVRVSELITPKPATLVKPFAVPLDRSMLLEELFQAHERSAKKERI